MLERYALEGKLTSKIQLSQLGKVTYAFETSTREGAKIRLNGWRFLLTDDTKELDIRQPFMLNGEIHVLVDIDPRRMEKSPWIVENDQGERTFISTGALRDCLVAAEERVYKPKTVDIQKVATNYATWG